jgi:biopolymer transport protein ExbB
VAGRISMVRTFFTLIDEGGWVLWPIFAVSVLSWYIGIKKVFLLRKITYIREIFFIKKIDDFEKVSTSEKVNSTQFYPYKLLLKELTREGNVGPKQREYLFREFLANVVPDLEKGLSTMSACVSIAPLLGLLGTITGMNKMFAVITDFGLGSPSLMAGGISVALESALTGLTVAVASMFFHNWLYNRKNACVQLLMKDGEKLINLHIG